MLIIVKLLPRNRKSIGLEVDNTDSILNLKEKIQDKEGIPPDLQRLKFNNKILDDNKYLQQYNIQSEDTLILDFNPYVDFGINIAVPPKNQITLKVNNIHTINYIKKLIFEQTGILIGQQQLFFHGNMLEDKKTIQECNIEYYNLLYLKVIDELMMIYIKTPQNKIISIQLKQEDTIQNIKLKIKEREGIPFDPQQLIFAGRTLENMKTLKEYDIQNESTLHLMFEDKNKIQIFIQTHENKVVSIDLSTEDTIDQVKYKIADKEGIEPDQKELDFIMKQLENKKIFNQNHIEYSAGLLLSHQIQDIQIQKIHIIDQKQEVENSEIEKIHTIKDNFTNSISNSRTLQLEQQNQQSNQINNNRMIRLLQKIHDAKSEKEINLRVNHICKQIESLKEDCIDSSINIQFCQNLKDQIEQGLISIQKLLIRIVHSISQICNNAEIIEGENEYIILFKGMDLRLFISFKESGIQKIVEESGIQKTIEKIMRREIKDEENESQGGIVKYSESVVQIIETFSFIIEQKQIEYQNCEQCGRFFIQFFTYLVNNLKNQQQTEQNHLMVNQNIIRQISMDIDEGLRMLRSLRRITLAQQNVLYFIDNFDMINIIIQLIHVNCAQELNCPYRISIPIIQQLSSLQFQFAVFGALFLFVLQTGKIENNLENNESSYLHIQQLIVLHATNILNQSYKSIFPIQSTIQSQNQLITSQLMDQQPDNIDVLLTLLLHLLFHEYYSFRIILQCAHGIFGAFSILSRNRGNKYQQIDNQRLKMLIIKTSRKCLIRTIRQSSEQAIIQMKNKELINEQQFMRQQVEIFGTAGGIGEENMEDVLDSLHNVSCILNGYKEIKDADDSYVESKKRCLEQSIEEGGIEEIESYIKHKYISYRYYYTVKISYNVKKAIVNNWNDPTNNQ